MHATTYQPGIVLVATPPQLDKLRIVCPALLVRWLPDPRAIPRQNRPKIGELRVVAVALDQLGDTQPAVPLAPEQATSNIAILSTLLPSVTAPLLLISTVYTRLVGSVHSDRMFAI